MARTAELKLRTTHDGSQAEASLRRLQQTVNQSAAQIAGAWRSKVLSFFGPTALAAFLDSASTKTRQLTRDLKEAKITLKELNEAGTSTGDAEAINAIDVRNAQIADQNIPRFRRMLYALGIAVGGSAAVLRSDKEAEAFAKVLYGDLGELKSIDAENRLNQKLLNRGKGASTANSILKSILGFSPVELSQAMFSAESAVSSRGSTNKAERENQFSRVFSNLQRVGAYAYSTGDPVMQVQRDQLRTLKNIERAINKQSRQLLERNGDVMFPP